MIWLWLATALMLGFVIGCVFEGAKAGGTIDLKTQLGILPDPERDPAPVITERRAAHLSGDGGFR